MDETFFAYLQRLEMMAFFSGYPLIYAVVLFIAGNQQFKSWFKRRLLSLLPYAYALVGMILPIIILLFKKGRRPLPMFIAGVMIVVGAWFKRYLIVTPTLLHPFLPMQDVPESYRHYFPSWEEWAIAMGSLAGALLVITFFARVYPIIPIQETINEKNELDEKK